MFPNSHDALPLPAQPNLEQYRKLAKDLVKVASTPEPSALGAWTADWLRTLARPAHLESTEQLRIEVEQWMPAFEGFVQGRKSAGKLSLAKAQFVLARTHGFESWPKFAKHLEAVARANSQESDFEAAADAITNGNFAALARLLKDKPALVRTRSTRQHRATLLHYVAANGVESYRQKTPKNAVQITKLLLDSGADVTAGADLYAGGATPLELVATSIHPERAGVQEELLQLLLDRGATEQATSRQGRSVIGACLGNGRPRAAEFLAQRGFHIDLEAAAGLGRLDILRSFLDRPGSAAQEQMERGLCWACEYGKVDAVHLLLQRGVSVEAKVSGQTPLHWAAIGAHLDTIKLLLTHGADPEAKNAYGGTALEQALWSAAHSDRALDYVAVIHALLAAGAKIPENATAWINNQRGLAVEEKQRIIDLLIKHGAGAPSALT